MDQKSGRVLFGHDIDKSLGIASVTKIVTALLALENGDPSSVVKISKNAVGLEGSSLYLYEGESITLENLLYALMLKSANDCAVAIAEHISGSVAKFADLMNQRTAELGAKNSHFVNPNGLTERDESCNVSSAHDLALITAHCLLIPKFSEIVKTKSKTITRQNGIKYKMKNHNRFLTMYEGTCGVKTGFTKKAGRCLVTSVNKNNMNLIFVTLNDCDDWLDHKNAYDYAYSNYSPKLILKKGTSFGKIQIINGVEKTLKLTAKEDIFIPVKENENVEFMIKISELKAPVYVGQIVGEIAVKINDEEIIIPIKSPKEIMFKNVLYKVQGEFSKNFEILLRAWIAT